MNKMTGSREILIIGGGIIGCSTAYYLTRHPAYDHSKHKIILLEASDIACGASGKAGGLLARWAYPSNIVSLSYKLHAELAKEHNGEERWGYREIHSGQIDVSVSLESADNCEVGLFGSLTSLSKHDKGATETPKSSKIPSDLDWIVAKNISRYQEIGDPTNTAQVHPYHLTSSLAGLAQERGVEIKLGIRAKSINQSQNRVDSVLVEDRLGKTATLQATDVILAAGPWSSRIYPGIPISGMRAHSVTIKPMRPLSAYALFTEISGSGKAPYQASPEIYARPNNEVYACSEGDEKIPLPNTAPEVEVDDSYCNSIIKQVGLISNELRGGEIMARQACYLPNVVGALPGPLIGRGNIEGLYIGAGHTCWGIQNGPGTGRLLSEFVFDGKARSADVSDLDPRAFF